MTGSGTVTFWWKVSSEQNYDWLEFYIDQVRKDRISGEVDWQQKTYTISGSGTHYLRWQYIKDSSTKSGDDCGWVDWVQGPGTTPPQPDYYAQALDCNLSFTTSGQPWCTQSSTYYHDNDAAQSGYVWYYGPDSCLLTTIEGEGTLSFWWKVSCGNYGILKFYVDGVMKDQINGEVDWQQKTYTITGTGSHTLKWRYYKTWPYSEGSDCGWVDWLQWGGSPPPPPQSILPPTDWKEVTYTYDPMGRRIAKSVDTWTQRYVYDGDMVIAEYDGSGNLLRKYVHAGTDRPICAIEVADNNAVSYYHYDGLGSCRGLERLQWGYDPNLRVRHLWKSSGRGRQPSESLHVHGPEVRHRDRALLLQGQVLQSAYRAVHADRPDRV